MISADLISEAVGIDYSHRLLQEALEAAHANDLAVRYHQMNVNAAAFPDEEFDLVVNYAAGHHIAMVDHVFREICRLLPEDGWFLSFDYVGPHRNQYTPEAWERAWKINNELPPRVRQLMTYPHLPTMLHDDPTEAIHSELIVETLHRYFDVERFVPLGGAIAYPLLTHNEGLFALADKAEQTKWVEEVLRADEEFLGEHPDSTLFAVVIATPRKAALKHPDVLAGWEKEENDREEQARQNGGSTTPAPLFRMCTVACSRKPRSRHDCETRPLIFGVSSVQYGATRCAPASQRFVCRSSSPPYAILRGRVDRKARHDNPLSLGPGRPPRIKRAGHPPARPVPESSGFTGTRAHTIIWSRERNKLLSVGLIRTAVVLIRRGHDGSRRRRSPTRVRLRTQ